MKKFFILIFFAVSFAGISIYTHADTTQDLKIDKQDKQAYNKIYPEIIDLDRQRSKELAKEKDPMTQEKINKKFQAKMKKKIRDSGLSLEKFNALTANNP